jgi:hypothetical protein
MTDDASLRGDCSRCIGLCCVALAFDRGPLFASDKPAGEPCRHLTGHDACAIHDRLGPEGFGGCAGYDCRGAGQLVTALFAGHSWRDSPATARQMFAAFAKLREVQTMRSVARSLATLSIRLDPPGGWTLEALLLVDVNALRAKLADQLTAPSPASGTGGSGSNAHTLR